MKKLLLLLTLFVFTSTQAQLSYGVKGGLTIGHINLDIPEDFTNTPSYGGHITMFFTIGKDVPKRFAHLRFQPEISFIQKGVRIDDDMSDSYMRLRLNYLEIPLLCRSDIHWGEANVYFTYGVYFAILLSNGYETEGLEKYLLESDNGTPDGGLVMSIGLEFNKVLLEVRGACGLVNTAANSQEFYDDTRNNYVNVSLGYKIK